MAAAVSRFRAAPGAERVAKAGRWLLAHGRPLALATLVGVAAIRLWDPAPLATARYQVFDLMQRISPRPPVESQVAIVDVDEASIRALGQWPWSRDRLAQMVERLAAADVAAIGFDIVFSEADRLSPSAFAARTEDLPPMIRGVLSGLPDTDAAFAEAIGRAPVVLGMSGSLETLSAPEELDQLGAVDAPVAQSFAQIGGDPRPFLFGFPGVLRNLSSLEASAQGIGLFNLAPEGDGVVRRVPAALRVGGVVLPTLTIEMLRVAKGAGSAGLVRRPDGAGISGVGVGALFAPTDVNGRMWLHFAEHDPSLYVSAAELIAGRTPPERLAGKYVLVGTSAVGLRDLRITPLGQTIPGVEVHAQLLDAILRDEHLARPAEMAPLEHLIALLAGLAVIAAAPSLSAQRGAALAVGTAGAIWVGAGLSFHQAGLAFDPSYPSVAALLAAGVMGYFGYARAEAQRRQIRSAFSQYLSPAMVAQLAEDPERLRLTGESRPMTFLFCDIAGFTAFVEKADPEELVRHLNEYLDGVCALVMSHGGTVDKIVGDAVHAMFNAPLDDAEHAENAVRAALAIEAFVDDFRARKAAEGVDFGRTRIGVNTGPAIVGNFGGESRFDYTAHGDAINTAARLESVNKHLGTTICVAGSTVAACRDIAFRPIGRLFLKGKDNGLDAFTPLQPERADAAVDGYAAAFEALAEAGPDHREALAAMFETLAETAPNDPLIALHRGRLAAGDVGVEIRMTEK